MEPLLTRVVEHLSALVAPLHSTLKAEVSQALAPGKLFRPRLALGVAAALGMPAREAAIRAAVAVELLHMSSLIHDDLMDGSPQRRGVPAVHVAASPATAIAIGNLLLARAASVAASLGPASARTFARALECLWEGQLMEPELALSGSRSVHLRYIAMKTAALIAASAELAALSQGAGEQQSTHLARFGHEIGMAFQVADDLLDHIGDPVTLGKNVGSDTSRGVVSLGAWYVLALTGSTLDVTGAAVLNSLAAEDEPVNHALDVIADYLGAARTALADGGVRDTGAWHDARQHIARMVMRGAAADRRELVQQGVARWPG